MKEMNKEHQEIGKKLDPKDLLEYIQLFVHLFNKKFKKLLKWRKCNYEINLLENILRELNIKAYIIIVKKDKVLNQ